MSALLETHGLARYFGGGGMFDRAPPVRAVDGVDLAIQRGETFAIVGESGSGKSTLARLMARLLSPTAGQVTFEGEDVSALQGAALRDLRRRVQFIFQDPFSSLNPRASVGTLIGEPIETHAPQLSRAARRDKVAEMLVRVGLRPDQMNRYPHEFSGGQRQRIGIARALASRPELVIGDEPVSALDVSVQAQVVNLLGDLKAEFGLTLVVIAHDLAIIRHMSDRIAVTYLGRIMETGTTDALFDQPRHPYTRALLAAIPEAVPARDRRGPPLTGDIPSPANPPSGCRFRTRCPFAQPLCAEAVPALVPDERGHATACHFCPEIAARAPYQGFLTDTGRTAAAERRMQLYRRAIDDPSTVPEGRHHP